jgi:hypothetical protein
MVHVALTSQCKHSLAATADMPIALFPIWNQDEPEWLQCLEAMCDLTSLNYSASAAQMSKYVRYLSNLQHNTNRVITEQCAHLNAYAEQSTSRHT